MKPDIHPKYYEAKVHCGSCGTEWTVGSTRPELRVDVCSNCHPFFTGTQNIIDTAGQVERFQKRLERQAREPSRRSQTLTIDDGRPDGPAVAIPAARPARRIAGRLAGDVVQPAPPAAPAGARRYAYGGQALMEGVLMRGRDAIAVALRHPGRPDRRPRPSGSTRASMASPVAKWPFVRGLVVLYETLSSARAG